MSPRWVKLPTVATPEPMQTIDLKYGRTTIPFSFDPQQFEVLHCAEAPPLSDASLGERLDTPIGSPPLEEMVAAGESVLIVVPDATRQVGCGQVVNLLVRRLIASGVDAFDISIIFATGIHRAVTDDERSAILTPFIAQRIKTIAHAPRDLMQILNLGETSDGIPVQLNRALVEHDHVMLIGGINFHYFAGFTGGRKLICPGLASSQTISATHKLAFDCAALDRRIGVGTGLLDGNPVHDAFAEAASKIGSVFCVSTHVNECGEASELFSGDLVTSHRAACEAYAAAHTVEIAEKRDLVIVSCGFPFDINMIQAHKALDAASHACTDGGTIILLAECSEGPGRSDFLNWFQSRNSSELAIKLCEKYQVNGQTAWSLLKKTERFDVKIVTTIAESDVSQMRMRKVELESLYAGASRSGYIIPKASGINIISPD